MEILPNYKISLSNLGQKPTAENMQERGLVEKALKSLEDKLSDPQLSQTQKEELLRDFNRLTADYDELSMSPTAGLSKSELIFVYQHTQ